jgi:hypothetical protein
MSELGLESQEADAKKTGMTVSICSRVFDLVVLTRTHGEEGWSRSQLWL